MKHLDKLVRVSSSDRARHRVARRGGRAWLFIAALIGATACLGAARLKPDERVVFFSSLGWRTAQGWQAEVRGCVFEPESRRLVASVVRPWFGLDQDALTPGEQTMMRERLRLLLADHQRGKQIRIEVGGQRQTLGPSQANGHFHGSVLLPASTSARVVPFRTATTPGSAPVADGVIRLLEPQGLSVVSDIDDTIKVSQVRDREELLRNTLCRPFRPVPGIVEVYRSWAHDGAQFHYVSASPWQLYVPLADFVRTNGFPAGSFHLRQVRIKDGTFLELLKSAKEHKRSALTPLLERYPGRRFVLVGDSGEEDPEIYGALARAHARQVHRILIRDVTGESASAERYQRAFAGLPPGLWRVFSDPDEIRDAVR